MSAPPSAREISAALHRAAEFRRDVYRGDPAYDGHVDIEDRVLAEASKPHSVGDDWWEVGTLSDTITHEVWTIRYRPRRLRLMTRYTCVPTEKGRSYQRGDNLQWMDRETD